MTEIETAQKDQYYSIQEPVRAELKVRSSKFIAVAIPIVTRDEAKKEVDELRQEFFDASHHCYAYRLGIQGLESRMADDGEPSGTAGRPILFAIQKYTFSDVLVVVTRYFGGTKLGRGGLARAYSDAAELVLGQCTRKIVSQTQDVRIFCTYEDLKLVLPLIEASAVHVKSDYQDAVVFDVKILLSQVVDFVESIQRVTHSRAGCVVGIED